jgi:hypothetical protein
MKADLPPDADRELDFPGVLETLARLDGETVLVGQDALGARTRVVAVGRLAPLTLPHAAGFTVGGTVVLTLAAEDFAGARLRTTDGTDFFRLDLRFGGGAFVIGDPDALATDYEEAVPE